jgi:hypothetical protein
VPLGIDPIDINPSEFFDRLAAVASGEADEDWQALLWIDRLGGDEEIGRALRAPALRLLTAAAEMVTTLATREWGHPEFTFTRELQKPPPEWMQLYLYPNGVPVTWHYLAGWRRERRTDERVYEVVPLVFINENDGGRPGWWALSLELGLHEF